MKRIVLLLVFVICFFSTMVHADDSIDGVWEWEGAHATLELILREHEGIIFGALLSGEGNPRKWKSFVVTDGKREKSGEFSIAIMTDGCGRSEDGVYESTLIKGIPVEGGLVATLRLVPRCFSGEKTVIFHKE